MSASPTEGDALGALLRSARLDEPPPGAMARATAGAIAALSSPAAPGAPVLRQSYSLLKWGAVVGLAVVAAVLIALVLLAGRTISPPDPADNHVPVVALPVVTDEPVATGAPSVPLAEVPSAPPAVALSSLPLAPLPARASSSGHPNVVHTAAPVASEAPEEDSLNAELHAIDVARVALRGGNAARCLGLLDDYAKRFPRGRLSLEAAVTRIEALAKGGDRGAALTLADRLLAAQPNSPYATRIRALLGIAKPLPSASAPVSSSEHIQ